MRILIDTNILISSILFPKSSVAKTLLYITDHHNIVLCEQNITELREVLKRKKPDKLPDAEILLAEMSYELIPASHGTGKLIRHAKDQPILNAAITANVDLILTGDKDFLSLNLIHPRCMNVAQFVAMEHIEL